MEYRKLGKTGLDGGVIGLGTEHLEKTRDALELVPDTKVDAIERCSGHDGTYAVKKEFFETSKKIARPVVNKIKRAEPSHVASDCPMAGEQIAGGLENVKSEHPMTLLRRAYGI